jgi:hypothetical protein
MLDVVASLFVNVHPSKAKISLFRDSKCFVIASTVSAYFLRQMMLRVIGDGSTRASCNAFYDRPSFRFDIAFHRIYAETNTNIG